MTAVGQEKRARKIMVLHRFAETPEFVTGTHWTVGADISGVVASSNGRRENLLVWNNDQLVAEFHDWTGVKFGDSR